MTTRRPSPLAVLLLLLPALALAQEEDREDDEWALCRPSTEVIPLPELGPADDLAMRIEADSVEAESGGISRFSGHVVLLRGGQRIEADGAVYDHINNTLTLEGAVSLYTADSALSGDRAQLDLDSDTGELHGARYHLRTAHASGGADRVLIRGAQYTELDGASYTTCDPDKVDWLLKARSIDLDEESNTGEARSVVLEFKGVPFLYLPYINFPLHGRKTGLLPPRFGYSDKTGTDIAIPWYWNIAPNYDATLTPRHMNARGTQLQGEFRYLHATNAGQLNVEGLRADKLYNEEDRYAGSYRHDGRPGTGWTNSIVYNYVSDVDYFNDLGNSQAVASATHLERRFDLAYRGEGWDILGRVQGYQTLSGSDAYQRLPQLRLNAATPRRGNRLNYSLASELVRFAHDDLQPTGNRLDLKPALTLPLEGPAWFFTPRFAVRHTQYQLRDMAGEEAPSRTTPISSLDTGLFFERDTAVGDHPLVHTLEPRLYYLYVPYREQDGLPVFDTATNDFSFAQLFRDNRFSGADRQGDANQLTAALTSRLLAGDSGRELLRASIGQIQYFEDRRVTLPGSVVQEQQTSDVVAELAAQPLHGLDLSATTRWNPHDERSEVVTHRARYHPDERRLLSVSYRYRRDQMLRQTDLVGYWPLFQRWRLLARWNYDMELDRTLEAIGGVAWDDCCWALHLVARERLDTTTLDTSRSYMLTLELKGLSSFGRRLEDELATFRPR